MIEDSIDLDSLNETQLYKAIFMGGPDASDNGTP